MNQVLFTDATEELQTLAEALESGGYRVQASPLAHAAERLSAGEQFEVLLLNLMDLANMDAARAVLEVASGSASIAIVRREQLANLDPGLPVDDFAIAPMASEELVARIRRAIHRQAGEADGNLLRCGDLTIDQASYRVFVGSRPVELTYKEYELLRFLALNQDKVCTREILLSRVWGYDFYGGARTVDVHIRRLRSKIEDPDHALIETVRNVGYRLRVS